MLFQIIVWVREGAKFSLLPGCYALRALTLYASPPRFLFGLHSLAFFFPLSEAEKSKMPSHDHCCVPLCTNRRDKCPNVRFHCFPREERLRARWLVAIRRDEGEFFRISGSTVVCSDPFLPSDYPPWSDVNGESGEHARRRVRLRPEAVPSVLAFKAKQVVRASPDQRRQDAEKRQECLCLLASLPKFGPMTLEESREKEMKETEKKIKELSTRVDVLTLENTHLRSQLLRFQNVAKDDEQLMFFTGINKEIWSALWFLLQPEGGGIVSNRSVMDGVRKRSTGAGRKDELSLEDQLLLTFMRFCLGRLEQDLSYQFGVSVATISRIVVKWTNFMYLRLTQLPLWPDWTDVEATMPAAFKISYPNTVAIIDATELKCEVPSSLSLQSKHYSAYKSHTTLKGLVAIAPNGSFIFLSQLFGGSISDRALFEKSGVLRLLDSVPPGKSVMADRGFEVQDLLVKPGLILNAPPFKGSRTALTEDEVKKRQKIAQVRIHVERAIGQVKSRFHIFDSTIPLAIAGSVNQMWTVCGILSNFFGPLVAETDAEVNEDI